jgi:TetR/AcrR family transcriptional repressor of nem operon
MTNKPDVREKIMAVAKATVQARGYNVLSFREVAKEVGIKSASVHYHFPTKADLAAALARRYTDDGEALFAEILGASQDPTWCMDQYIAIFRVALANDNRMCLCGIMSAEFDDLPDSVRVEVNRFNDVNIVWLAQVLAFATPDANEKSLKERATAIFAAMEGAQLVARGREEIAVYDNTMRTYRTLGLIP